MKIFRLEWLFLRSYIGPLLMSFAVILFILVMQFMALYMDEIFGKGLGLDVIGKLFFYASGRLSITALPVALLAAGLITYGTLGENYELAAIKSSGINIFRTMRPLIFVGLIMTGISYWFTFNVIPSSNLKFFSLLYDVQRKKPDVAIKPGHFYNDIDGFVIRVSDKDLSTGTLYDVMIYDHTEKRGNTNIILADSALTHLLPGGRSMKMTLYSGSRYEEYKPEAGKPDTYKHGRTYYDSLYYHFNLSGFDLSRTDESHFKHQITMPMARLGRSVDSLNKLSIANRRKYFDQVGRYTRVDTSFEQAGIYTRRISLPNTPDKIEGIPQNLDSTSTKNDTASATKTQMSSLAEVSPKASVEHSVENASKTVKVSSASSNSAVSSKENVRNPLRTRIERDTIPVIPAEVSQGELIECFEEVEPHELANRALTNARAVKSYLEFMIKKKAEDDKTVRKYYFEYYHRYAIPLTCLLFVLIGASLGAIIRKGGLGFPSLISLILFILFYVMITQGKKMAREDVILPWVGAFLPVMVFGPLSILLTYQATTDSRILDEHIWSSLGDRMNSLFQAVRTFMFRRKGTLPSSIIDQ